MFAKYEISDKAKAKKSIKCTHFCCFPVVTKFFLSLNISAKIFYLKYNQNSITEPNQLEKMDPSSMQISKMEEQEHPIMIPEERVGLDLVTSKPTLIGFDYHQIAVQQFPEGKSKLPIPENYLQSLSSQLRPKPIFLSRKADEEKLQEYLKFAESYFEEKIPQIFSQNIASRERMRAKAMQFLHDMDYNYTRAKFYIFFPYYIRYNKYRAHMPLQISDEEMEKKIKDHIDGMRNTKEKDLEKWIGTVQNSIESRVQLSKLMGYIQIAKQNKFDIPETIREQIEKAQKTGKEVKKAMQGVRLPIEKLIAKRDHLQNYKIITTEMITFEQTVNRCEQWVKKQSAFQEKYFDFKEFETMQQQKYEVDIEKQGSQKYRKREIACLKPEQQKMQYKTIVSLYNQYNNLPLKYDSFDQTTKKLYLSTQSLLQKIPPFIKAPNTRKNNPVKYSYQQILILLGQTRAHPVYHEQFQNFESVVSEAMQFIQKVGMFLQDDRAQKTVKVLNNYQKLINESPIQSSVQQKLESKLEYYQLMEKIKKDILNPQKFQQIKESIKKLREKGYQSIEHANYETKLTTMMGWSESHQILSQQQKDPTIVQLFKSEKEIKGRMIDVELFKEQLESAKNQIKIEETTISDYEVKLQNIASKVPLILEMINASSCDLKRMVEELMKSIRIGLKYPQFQQLYDEVLKHIKVLAKIYYILDINNKMLQDGEQLFLSDREWQTILNFCNLSRQGVRSLKTRAVVEQLQKQIRDKPFPKDLLEYRLFLKQIEQDSAKREQVLGMIEAFKQDDKKYQIKDILEQYKDCFSCAVIDGELVKIETIAKWRDKINRKLFEQKQQIFDDEDTKIVQKLVSDLQEFEKQAKGKQETRMLALQYFQQKTQSIDKLLAKINQAHIPQTYKLSQLNKFCKQVDKQLDKFQLSHKTINQLKAQLQRQIGESDVWKEKYNVIKRFEERKLKEITEDKASRVDRQRSENEQQAKSQGLKQSSFHFDRQDFDNENVQLPNFSSIKISEKDESPNQNGSLVAIPEDVEAEQKQYNTSKIKSRNAAILKNPEFFWYFKFILLIIEFYHGYKLKFSLEDVVKLKNMLSEIYKFTTKYRQFEKKEEPSDQDLLSLESQSVRINLFVRQVFITKVRVQYVESWKNMANSIIKSVPIVNMQLKARNPQDLLNIIKMEKQKQLQNIQQQNKQQEKKIDDSTNKRKRKVNPFYNNEEMTLLNDDTFGKQPKKKRKANLSSDGDYRNTAVTNQARKDKKKTQLQLQQIEYPRQIAIEMLEVEDPLTYCICREGVLNQNSFMIQCDECDQWFHSECMNLKKSMQRPDFRYWCIGCRQIWGKQKAGGVGQYFWDSFNKLTRNQFFELVQQGKQLGVSTTELGKLQKIKKKMLEWQQDVKNIFESLMMDLDDLEQTECQKYRIDVYQLYLHSFWLPTTHPQTEALKRIYIRLFQMVEQL